METASNVIEGSSKDPFNDPTLYRAAAQAQIVRSTQKDAYYLYSLKEQTENLLRSFLGTRWLQRYVQEVDMSTKLLYFGLTTLAGSQTLGEEYTDILQFTSQKRPPARLRRVALLALHVVGPYVLLKLYNRLVRYIRRLQEDVDPVALEEDAWSTWWKKRLVSVNLPSFESLVQEHVKPIHVALFYLTGKYYSIAKRFLMVRYISVQPISNASQLPEPPSYEILGALMAVQVITRLVTTLRRNRAASDQQVEQSEPKSDKLVNSEKKREKSTVDDIPLDQKTFDPDRPDAALDSVQLDYDNLDEEEDLARRCTLCLGPQKDPTCAECGHVFCWECIVGWVREKSECPLCRQTVSLSHLLPIYNL